jgi:hypothetical protein
MRRVLLNHGKQKSISAFFLLIIFFYIPQAIETRKLTRELERYSTKKNCKGARNISPYNNKQTSKSTNSDRKNKRNS